MFHIHRYKFFSEWYPDIKAPVVEKARFGARCKCGKEKDISEYDDRKFRPYAYENGKLKSEFTPL